MNPSHDRVLVALLLVTFALFVTVHVTIAIGLVRRIPRWRAPVALIVAPLAPYWAMRETMYVRGVLWIVSAIAYVIARVLASSSSGGL